MKNSFVMYNDWEDMIEELDDESRSQLLLAIMRYQSGKELPEMSAGARVAFAMIRHQFQIDSAKYEESSRKRAEAGRAGGLSKSNNAKQNVAMLSNAKQDVANVADNDNDNDYKRESTLKGTREKSQEPKQTKAELTRKLFMKNIADYNFSSRVNESLTDWIDYKIGRKQFYETDVGMKKLLNKVSKEISEHGEDAVIGAIDDSMANNYQGIVWDRIERNQQKQTSVYKKNQYNNFDQRTYDYDELERQLLTRSRGGG